MASSAKAHGTLSPDHQGLANTLITVLKPIVGRIKRIEAGGTGSRHVHLINDLRAPHVLTDVVSKDEFIALLTAVEKLAKLVQQIERRESSRAMAYRGIWDSSVTDYAEGDYVTHAGGLWHANQATRAKPGTSDDWQLAVKRGRGGA